VTTKGYHMMHDSARLLLVWPASAPEMAVLSCLQVDVINRGLGGYNTRWMLELMQVCLYDWLHW
jgi:hypothetical protein